MEYVKHFALDIETIPDETAEPPEVKLGNLKDPDKIEAKKKEAASKMALSPWTGRVCAYGLYGNEIREKDVLVSIDDQMERAMLEGLFSHLTHQAHVVTWNGNGFDFPFIYMRAVLLGLEAHLVPEPLSWWTKRYQTCPHMDLMQVSANWNPSATVSLDVAAKRILGEQKTERNYSEYAAMIKAGEGHRIREDAFSDARLTWAIYQRFKPIMDRSVRRKAVA